MRGHTPLRAWVINDSEPLRERCAEAIIKAGLPLRVLDWGEADEWRAIAGIPDSVALTGWDLAHCSRACRPYVEGVGRILILADVPVSELAGPLLERPGIAALQCPFQPDAFELALRWMACETLEPEWDGAELAGLLPGSLDVEAPSPGERPPRPNARAAPRGRRTSGAQELPGGGRTTGRAWSVQADTSIGESSAGAARGGGSTMRHASRPQRAAEGPSVMV